jgi:hypothetical protein
MRRREQYKLKKNAWKRVFVVARQVINEWDPYGLMACGCPEDEFDSEVNAVIRQLDRIGSAEDAAQVLSRIFSSSFDPEPFTIEQCRPAGQRLYQALSEM